MKLGGELTCCWPKTKIEAKNYNSLSSRTRGRNEVTEVSPLSFASRFVFKTPTFP